MPGRRLIDDFGRPVVFGRQVCAAAVTKQGIKPKYNKVCAPELCQEAIAALSDGPVTSITRNKTATS